jgi:hypothetical protein
MAAEFALSAPKAAVANATKSAIRPKKRTEDFPGFMVR